MVVRVAQYFLKHVPFNAKSIVAGYVSGYGMEPRRELESGLLLEPGSV